MSLAPLLALRRTVTNQYDALDYDLVMEALGQLDAIREFVGHAAEHFAAS